MGDFKATSPNGNAYFATAKCTFQVHMNHIQIYMHSNQSRVFFDHSKNDVVIHDKTKTKQQQQNQTGNNTYTCTLRNMLIQNL